MMTIILYISKDGKMSDVCKYFLEDGIKTGRICVLEYPEEIKQNIETEERSGDILREHVGKICGDIIEKIRYIDIWKLLLIDDRKLDIIPENLYDRKHIFWRCTKTLLENICNGTYQAVLPIGVYMISSIASMYSNMAGEKKEAVKCSYIEEQDFPVFPRLFIYNFLGDKKRIYEIEMMIFSAIIFYFANLDIPVDYFYFSKIYEINVEWSWKGFHDYLEEKKKEFREHEEQIKGEMLNIFAPYGMPVYIDSFMDRYYNEVERKSVKRTITLKGIIKTKEEFEKVHKKMMKEMQEQFRKIRGVHYEGFSIEWDERDTIYEAIENYESELVDLYHEEVWDYERTKVKLGEIEKRVIKSRRNRKTIFLYVMKSIIMIFLFLKLSYCYEKQNCLIALFLGIIFLTVILGRRIFLIQTARVLTLEERLVWDEIGSKIERENRRIETEIKYMAKYMRNYYIHYIVRRQEEERKRKYREDLRMLQEIERIKELLVRMSKVDQLENNEIIFPPKVRNRVALSIENFTELFPFIHDISINELRIIKK